MANVFNSLGQKILPLIFTKLSGVGLTDQMDIITEATSAGAGGGRIKTALTVVYSNVPVLFEPAGDGTKNVQGDKLVSNQEYILTCPSHTPAGSRIAIDPKSHRLTVKARTGTGTEPAKNFRIISVKDKQGNLFEIRAIKED
jgi:hypothetical protein